MLNKTTLENNLPELNIIVKETTCSTNNDAKELLISNPSDTLITAETQTGGRGRQGKTFSSPAGGLYMTLLLKCGMPMTSAVGATSCAAVAVARALKKTCCIDAGIKWVNDIYVNRKKLCGILTEAVNDYTECITKYLIIGIGMNVLSSPILTPSPSQTSPAECTCLAELGINTPREEICAAAVRELLLMRSHEFRFDMIADEYTSHSVVIGSEISYTKNGVTKYGTAVGINEHGGLTVMSNGEIITLDSGEISVRALRNRN